MKLALFSGARTKRQRPRSRQALKMMQAQFFNMPCLKGISIDADKQTIFARVGSCAGYCRLGGGRRPRVAISDPIK